eukprot:GDKI01021376.1.p1 GENE.GDKI01021376.1~~GDKI01021376.1.p1  ORF type:complete len:443 (+),score=129.10 GDKI01021376.1:115-1443(+)
MFGFLRPKRLAYLVVLLFSLAAVFCIQTAESKKSSGTFTIGGAKTNGSMQYLTKFGFRIGRGPFKFRFKVVRPMPDPKMELKMHVFLDNHWEEVSSLDDCKRPPLSMVKRKITFRDNMKEWSEWSTGSLSQTVRPHVWYFTVSDCERPLPVQYKVQWEAIVQQEDGSHFSEELYGTLTLTVLQLLCYGALLGWMFVKGMKHMKSEGKLHPVVQFLFVSIAVQMASTAFHLLHLFAYSYNGTGLGFFDTLAEIAGTCAQFFISSLLMTIGMGYTLTHAKLNTVQGALPAAVAIGAVNVLLVWWGKLKGDSSFKFHENEGTVGWVILAIRVGVWVWFVVTSLQTQKESSNYQLKAFLKKFITASTLYFLAYPVLFGVTSLWIAPYVRHKVMVNGIFLMQCGSMAWLGALFMLKGEYFQVSSMSSSILPGGMSNFMGNRLNTHAD